MAVAKNLKSVVYLLGSRRSNKMPVSKNNKKRRSHKQWKRKMNIQRSEAKIVAKRDKQRQIVRKELSDV